MLRKIEIFCLEHFIVSLYILNFYHYQVQGINGFVTNRQLNPGDASKSAHCVAISPYGDHVGKIGPEDFFIRTLSIA